MKRFAALFAASVILAGCVAPTSSTGTTGGPAAAPFVNDKITMAQFQQIQTGMTYAQVVEILKRDGEELSRSELGGTLTIMYSWKNSDFSNMNAMFQNDKLTTKAQYGLK